MAGLDIIKVDLVYGEDNMVLFPSYRKFEKADGLVETTILDSFPEKIIAIGSLVSLEKVYIVFNKEGKLSPLNKSYLKEITK